MKKNTVHKQKKAHLTFLQILEGLEGVAISIACYLTWFLRPLRDRWGMGKNEANIPLPGDELIARPKSQFTHAIEINAPAKYVWPWVAQIGYGRGGFYSYEALEKLVGLNIHNSDVVLPQFQNPKVGDFIPFGPKDAYPLVICEQGRAMVIENWYDLDIKSVYDPKLSSPKNHLDLSWLWYVEVLDEYKTRFISRNRVDYTDSIKSKFMFGLLMEPVVFAMDRKMCYGIKKRAEYLYKNPENNCFRLTMKNDTKKIE